jgi:hypothetical protein
LEIQSVLKEGEKNILEMPDSGRFQNTVANPKKSVASGALNKSEWIKGRFNM